MRGWKSTRLYVALAVGLLLSGCSGGAAAPQDMGEPPDMVEPFDFASARRIMVQAMEYSFNPSTINVQLNEQVLLDVISLDRTHGFFLYDFGIDVQLAPQVDTLIPLIADKVGTFNFHCDFYCGSGHEQMAGLLIVSP
jgi:cytochrome c oxidase subunit 2